MAGPLPVHDYTSLESNIFNQPEAEPDLVNPDIKYVCPIHGGVLRQPIQTTCGHRMCQSCLLEYLAGEVLKECPVEDEDRDMVSLQSVYPDPGILREIRVLQVYCPFKAKGCKETMRYKETSSHVASCPYRPAQCLYASRGCRNLQTVLSLPRHQEDCGFKPVPCSVCGQEVNKADQRNHLDTTCPNTVIPCPYGCGTNTERKEMETHCNGCPYKPKACQYSQLGCDFQGREPELTQHEQNIASHFELLVSDVCDMKMGMRSIDIQSLTILKDRISHIQEMLTKTEADTQAKTQGVENRMVGAEKILEGLKADQRVIQEQVGGIRDSIAKIHEELTKRPQSFTNELKKLELTLAESVLRFQVLETTSYDGVLMWKIRDFTTRRRDASQGKTVSLYSQPFYSHRHGYKMCARVYLNGDGVGKGTHVSLYFVVMKGEYDALLTWPFQLEVTLMLLDQTPLRRHLRDSFHPDPVSTSFQRPGRSDMNVASGCPLFVAHSSLVSDGGDTDNHYVKDETIFIKVSVDTSRHTPQ